MEEDRAVVAHRPSGEQAVYGRAVQGIARAAGDFYNLEYGDLAAEYIPVLAGDEEVGGAQHLDIVQVLGMDDVFEEAGLVLPAGGSLVRDGAHVPDGPYQVRRLCAYAVYGVEIAAQASHLVLFAPGRAVVMVDISVCASAPGVAGIEHINAVLVVAVGYAVLGPSAAVVVEGGAAVPHRYHVGRTGSRYRVQILALGLTFSHAVNLPGYAIIMQNGACLSHRPYVARAYSPHAVDVVGGGADLRVPPRAVVEEYGAPGAHRPGVVRVQAGDVAQVVARGGWVLPRPVVLGCADGKPRAGQAYEGGDHYDQHR